MLPNAFEGRVAISGTVIRTVMLRITYINIPLAFAGLASLLGCARMFNASDAEKQQVVQLANGEVSQMFASVVPNWVNSKQCDTRSRDFNACGYYVNVSGLHSLTGMSTQAPHLFANIATDNVKATVERRVASVLIKVTAKCNFDSPGLLFGTSYSCVPEAPFETQVIVLIDAQGFFKRTWTVKSLNEDPESVRHRLEKIRVQQEQAKHAQERFEATQRLKVAITLDDNAAIKQALDQGADPNETLGIMRNQVRYNYAGDETPLHLAIGQKNIEAVKWLIEKGADVNRRGGYNALTPLRMAIYFRTPDIVQVLVEHGANKGLDNPLNDAQECADKGDERCKQIVTALKQ